MSQVDENPPFDGAAEPRTANGELDWFAFEIRVRKMVMEMLEPTIKRVANERQLYISSKKVIDTLKNRFDNLEHIVLMTEERTTVFDEIHRKIAQIDSDRKVTEAKLMQSIENTRNLTLSLKERLTYLETEREAVQGQMATISEEIRLCRYQTLGMKEQVASEISRAAERCNQNFFDNKTLCREIAEKNRFMESLTQSHATELGGLGSGL